MKINWEKFDLQYGFSGQLGAIYRPEATTFRVWAPKTAETGVAKIELCLYGQNTEPTASCESIHEMQLGTSATPEQHASNTIAVWECRLPGDLKNLVYTYRVTYADGRSLETQDPYAQAVIVNGTRSVVLDPGDVPNPDLSKPTWRQEQATDLVVSEIHVRDFSISGTSGVSAANRGKYLGLIERGSKNAAGLKTGFDYLLESGCNAVQLMPVYDFGSVDETGQNPDKSYNWGYDPVNYNAPEGSYATDPFDPLSRICELKKALKTFHSHGLSVIMDVVYNHMYDSKSSSFETLVPGYYFRKTDNMVNGTRDVASEREMMSKFITDSVLHWTKNYGFDGFRFDLMGSLDVDTMRKIRAELDKIDRRIVVYGEGWNIPTDLPEKRRSIQKNLGLLAPIGMFNDAGRNAIKGHDFDGLSLGFVDGVDLRLKEVVKTRKIERLSLENQVIASLKGSKRFYRTQVLPEQAINYVEAHDNYNLNDILVVKHPKDSRQQHEKRVQLANAVNILCAGLVFTEIGQEFLRTKLVATGKNGRLTAADHKRAMNSYQAGDAVNAIDWDKLSENQATVDFVRQMLAFRAANPVFRSNDFDQIQAQFKLQEAEPYSGILIFTVNQPKTQQQFRIVINASDKPQTFSADQANLLVTNDESLTSGMLSGKFQLCDCGIAIFDSPRRIFSVAE